MQDPLNISVPLQGVDTSIPLLPEGDYEVQVKESTVDPNKDKTGFNWNLKLGITQPAVSVDGRDVKPDFPLFTVFALQAKDDSKDVEAFKRNLGSAVDAFFGTSKENRPAFDRELVNTAVGKTAIATVYIDEYPAGSGNKNNKVRRLKKAGA